MISVWPLSGVMLFWFGHFQEFCDNSTSSSFIMLKFRTNAAYINMSDSFVIYRLSICRTLFIYFYIQFFFCVFFFSFFIFPNGNRIARLPGYYILMIIYFICAG